jgi:hypothetical protein
MACEAFPFAIEAQVRKFQYNMLYSTLEFVVNELKK